MAQTYASYLKTDELLQLQKPLSQGPEHDELLFIVIHQVYELWFKQVLHELDEWGRRMEQGEIHRAQRSMNRVLRILKVMVGQIDVIETMTPLEFSSFRDRLDTASGFQSAQFREVEAALGFREAKTIAHFAPDSPDRARIEARRKAPSLWDCFVQYAQAKGFSLSADQDDESQDAELLRIYKDHPEAASVAERLVDLDEGIQEWRYRHVKMVQRTIGVKMGTGGSAGVAYLRSTLSKVAFPALWRVRAMM